MQTLSRTVDELTSSFAHSLLVSAMQTRQLNFAFFPVKGMPNAEEDTASRSDSVLLPPSADDDELDETSLTELTPTAASEASKDSTGKTALAYLLHRNEKYGRTPDQRFRDQVFDHYKNGQTSGGRWRAGPLFFSLTSGLTISDSSDRGGADHPFDTFGETYDAPFDQKVATKSLTIRFDHVFDHFESDRDKPSIGVLTMLGECLTTSMISRTRSL
ncbi:hypothetical protein THAOC_05105 [Thalassiosira oceanica]|uniref:Uncharacterized protein n=1 Tax=Thalassiosira oceanica TaxID=159749 RepID=K0TN86_THAOC|nr:hypothetical protein THAOC_05105 [Thalassiosira oceanica]|eukprot:EJK73282.1 hypothetical protein THAOC_05105 [Thalassiosira oceanica]